jgi:hypothetical protein
MRSTDSLRVGDAERDAAVAALARHFTDGRLNQEEHEERVGLALAARTGGDLRRLFNDLPRLEELRPAPRPGFTRFVAQPFAVVLVVAAVALVAMHLVPLPALLAFAFVGSRLAFGGRRSPSRWNR